MTIVDRATKKGSILVVEDEKALAHVLQLKLQNEGYHVVLAHDGQECLDLMAQHAFKTIQLDLLLPTADGFFVLKELAKSPKPPQVFVMSNLRQPEDEERALALGAKKYFVKSDIQLAELIEEIEKG